MKTPLDELKGMYHDKSGKEITLLEWGKLREDVNYCRIGHDKVGPFTISTVWVGLGFGDDSEGLFETIIFGSAHEDVWKYPTEDAAIEGHNAMLYALKTTHADIQGWVLIGG